MLIFGRRPRSIPLERPYAARRGHTVEGEETGPDLRFPRRERERRLTEEKGGEGEG